MRNLSVIFVSILSFIFPSQATEYLIQPDGTGDFPNIQTAVNNLTTGDIITLGDGTFTGPGNRDIDYQGKRITIRSESGAASSCILDINGAAGDPHRAFLFASGEDEDAKLENITITDAWFPEMGGAIYCHGSSPSVNGVRFISNIGDYGGAIFCENSSPVITDCHFKSNSNISGTGGAICCYSSSPTIADCWFTGNQTTNRGGAFYAKEDSSPQISDCTFTDNVAYVHGGAIYLHGLAAYDTSPVITDSFFYENQCNDFGGALVTVWSSPKVTNCTIYRNSSSLGAAIWCGGNTADATFTNCTIVDNITEWNGYVVYCNANCRITFDNCIIASNTTGNSKSMVLDNSDAVIHCSDIWGNPGGDWIEDIYYQLGIDGNICEDPLFCDISNNDLTIQDGSPCAPFTSPNEDCDLIGAWPVGCEGTTAIQSETWGGMKNLFR